MSDGEALLAAVVAAPEEDTPRLVYADWLDDHNEPGHAAFIRDQIEAARGVWTTFARKAWPGSLASLARVQPWSFGWRKPITLVVFAGGGSGYSRCVAWHRGFPAVVGCTERSWHHCYDTFRHTPITALCLTGPHGGVWGTYGQNAEGQELHQSMVNHRIRAVAPPGSDPTGVAFPHVRWWRRTACTRAMLDSVLQGSFGYEYAT